MLLFDPETVIIENDRHQVPVFNLFRVLVSVRSYFIIIEQTKKLSLPRFLHLSRGRG